MFIRVPELSFKGKSQDGPVQGCCKLEFGIHKTIYSNETFGVLEDCLPEHKQYYMKKKDKVN